VESFAIEEYYDKLSLLFPPCVFFKTASLPSYHSAVPPLTHIRQFRSLTPRIVIFSYRLLHILSKAKSVEEFFPILRVRWQLT
jgi:hypothetical protein